jgi:hypothetical protein
MNCATHSSFSLDIFADEKPADDYSPAIMESSFTKMIGLQTRDLELQREINRSVALVPFIEPADIVARFVLYDIST